MRRGAWPRLCVQAAMAGEPPSADAPDAGADAAGLQPSIQYEEAVAHATDRIAFTPGARVTVAFAPRAGDAGRSVARPRSRCRSGDSTGGRSATRAPRAIPGPGRALPDRSVDLPKRAEPRDPATPPRSRRSRPRARSRPRPRSRRRAPARDLRLPAVLGGRRSAPRSTGGRSRRSPTSASARTPTATSQKRNPTARPRSAGAAGPARR